MITQPHLVKGTIFFCHKQEYFLHKYIVQYCATQLKFKYVTLTKEKKNTKWAVNNTRGVYLLIFTAFLKIFVMLRIKRVELTE